MLGCAGAPCTRRDLRGSGGSCGPAPGAFGAFAGGAGRPSPRLRLRSRLRSRVRDAEGERGGGSRACAGAGERPRRRAPSFSRPGFWPRLGGCLRGVRPCEPSRRGVRDVREREGERAERCGVRCGGALGGDFLAGERAASCFRIAAISSVSGFSLFPISSCTTRAAARSGGNAAAATRAAASLSSRARALSRAHAALISLGLGFRV